MSDRAIDRHHAAICAASAEWLEDIAAFDEARAWVEDGATSMSAWLAARYGMARSTAREWVRVAHALRRLPAIREAFRCGELCIDQVKPLTRFVSEDEDESWAQRARSMAPAQLWTECRRRQRVRRDQAEIDAELRYFWMGWDDDGRTLRLEGELPSEQGAAVESALERAAEDVTMEENVRDPAGARLADALVGLVTSGSHGSGQPVVVVHTDVGVLAADEGSLAEIESVVALADETVRQLACDATVEWVIEAGGLPVGIGRRSRNIPPWLQRQLRHRDGGCRFPGCGRTRWLKAHHIWHWGHGGPTDLDNLVTLCHAHHRLLHEGGWTVRGHPNQRLRFHDPGGGEAFARSRAGPVRAA